MQIAPKAVEFKRVPIRSPRGLSFSKGQPCTLQFEGICNFDWETTVPAHIHDETFGRGQKADDTSTVDACHACHTSLDQRTHGLDDATLYWTLLRALIRTTRRRALDGSLAYFVRKA